MKRSQFLVFGLVVLLGCPQAEEDDDDAVADDDDAVSDDDSAGDDDDSGGDDDDSAGDDDDSGGDDDDSLPPELELGGAPRNPTDAGLIPVGSLAEGTTSAATTDGVVFHFTFEGDETLIYSIDTSDPDVQNGLLGVVEETTGAQPLAQAGMRYRSADGLVHPAPWLAGQAQVSLLSATLSSDLLSLEFSNLLPNGSERFHTFEVELIGKSLRIRVFDPSVGLDGTDNFAGFDLGPVEGVLDPVDLKLPYMISTPLAKFTSTVDGSEAFVTTQVDWSRSNAPEYNQPWTHSSVNVTENSISNSFSMRYGQSIQGGLMAPVDETVWVLVTRELSDAFPETEANPSPYRGTLEGRPVVLLSSSYTTWPEYLEQIELFDLWGMDNLAIYYFYWWSAAQPPPGSDPPQVPSHLWVPARDEALFLDLVARTSELGFLHGYYTLFAMNDEQEYHDPADACVGSDGRANGMAPGKSLSHSLREDGEMRSRYDTSLSFSDVLGYRHPRKKIDYDASDTTRSKTISGVLADKRALFQQMQDLHEGPALSEGSIANIGSNFELLYAGFVDSTEAAVNAAGGAVAANLPVDDPYAPENWWVVPDYALQVTNRTQAPHSNGFYNRFFAGQPVGPFPLAEEKMDRYRIYSITYGKTGYFHSNGPINGQGNLMAYADMIKEYYLMAGLQQDYLGSTIDSVLYWDGGELRDLQTVLRDSTLDNPLDALRDARIQESWQSGLVVYLNHGPEVWESIEAGGTSFTIPEDGWVAHNPNTGLFAFSAIPAALATEEQRIDYALVPDRYEMLDGRGDPVSFGNLESVAGWLVVDNQFRGTSVVEGSDGEVVAQQTSNPEIVALELQGPDGIQAGHLALLRPWATADTGAIQEFSYLLGTWQSSDPSVATVNRTGVVEALTAGSTEVTFTWQALVSPPHTVTVEAP